MRFWPIKPSNDFRTSGMIDAMWDNLHVNVIHVQAFWLMPSLAARAQSTLGAVIVSSDKKNLKECQFPLF